MKWMANMANASSTASIDPRALHRAGRELRRGPDLTQSGPFPKAAARPSAIRRNELDSRRFESGAERMEDNRRRVRPTVAFCPAHRRQAHARAARQFIGGHFHQCPTRPDLGGCDTQRII